MHHAMEVREHLLGDGEIGNYTVFHGPDGLDVAGDAAKHPFCVPTDRLDDFLAIGPAIVADGDDRRLVEHNSFATDVDQGIGGPQIDSHIAGEITAYKSEHGRSRSEEHTSALQSLMRI